MSENFGLLGVECQGCGHRSVFTPAAPMVTLGVLVRRMKCTRCKGKQAKARMMPTEREAKRWLEEIRR